MYLLNVTWHNPVFDMIMPIFHKGNVWRIPLIILWVLLMIFGGAKGRWAGLGAVIVLTLSDQISSSVIKPLVERIRPCNVLGNIWVWYNQAWIMTPDPVTQVYKGSLSFTSSHAANAGAQAFWWIAIYPRMKWFWIVLGFTIGYSRIYNGVHYPFDVLGGWIVGFICFGIVYIAAKKWGPRTLIRSHTSN